MAFPKMLARRAMLSPQVVAVFFVAGVILFVHYNLQQPSDTTERDVLDEPHHVSSSSEEGGGSYAGNWGSPLNWRLGNILPYGGGGAAATASAVLHADCPAQTEAPSTQSSSSSSDDTRRHRTTISPSALSVPLKHTRMLKHAPGWTVFENVYMAGGTFFIVTDEMSTWPEVRLMTSTGLPADSTPENAAQREPTARDMTFYTLKDAEKRWGDRVWEVDGLTFFVNDPGQFVSHYYHFVAETWFGIWRIYSSLDPHINVKGETTLESPARVIFAHCDQSQWRDYSFFNQYFLHAAFPGIGIETAKDWEGRSQLTSSPSHQKVWRFERLVFADRSASFRGHWPGGINQRIASEAWEGTREESSRWWWEPIRRSILRFSGVEQKVMDLPVMWTKEWKTVSNGDEKLSEKEVKVGEMAHRRMDVVVTYIVRNGKRRGMIKEDHELLVKSLTQLCDAKGWELNVVHAEKLTKEEQIQLAAKTTVMLGIHGNGLTHLVWMPLTPLSTVIEIFIPGGFAKDYEWTSRALGMRHYAVWNDTYFTHPNEPKVDYPEGFQGDRIPAYGPAIAKLIEDRVEGRLP